MSAHFAPIVDDAAEEAVLGGILRAAVSDRLDVVERVRATGLLPEHFTQGRRRRTYEAALALADRGVAPDVVAVSSELGEREDGLTYLRSLFEIASSFSNAPHFATQVVEARRRREHQRAIAAAADALAEGRLVDVVAPRVATRSGLVPVDLTLALAGPPPVPRYLWEPRVRVGDVVIVVSEAGVGKSLLMTGLAAAARDGLDFLGLPTARSRVGILDFEMPLDMALARLRGFGLTDDDHDGVVYFHAPPIDLRSGTGPLAGLVDEHDLDVLVIDSLRRAAPGLEENDSKASAEFFAGLLDLSRSKGTTVVVIHHARKGPGENGSARSMVRGSGDLVAAVDSVLFLRPNGQSEFRLEHAKARWGLPADPVDVRIESDEESGTIRLVPGAPGTLAVDEAARLDEIVAHLRKHPGEGTEAIAKALGRNRPDTADRLRRLEEAGTGYRSPSVYIDGVGRRRTRNGWFLASEAGSYPVRIPETGRDGEAFGPVPRSPSLPLGRTAGTGRDETASRPPVLGRRGFIAYAVEACRSSDELRETLGYHAEAARAFGDLEEAERALDEMLSRAREGSS